MQRVEVVVYGDPRDSHCVCDVLDSTPQDERTSFVKETNCGLLVVARKFLQGPAKFTLDALNDLLQDTMERGEPHPADEDSLPRRRFLVRSPSTDDVDADIRRAIAVCHMEEFADDSMEQIGCDIERRPEWSKVDLNPMALNCLDGQGHVPAGQTCDEWLDREVDSQHLFIVKPNRRPAH